MALTPTKLPVKEKLRMDTRLIPVPLPEMRLQSPAHFLVSVGALMPPMVSVELMAIMPPLLPVTTLPAIVAVARWPRCLPGIRRCAGTE